MIYLKDKQLKKEQYYKIQRRTMILSKATKIAQTVGTEVLATEIKRTYATYIVTEHNEKNPKENDPQEKHPSLEQIHCSKPDCNKKNCAQDTSSCDHDTKETAIVGHLTQSPDNVESSKTKVPLDHEGPRGEPVTAVIYEKSIPIPDNKMYEGYKHSDTVALQKDENTVKLNAATENMKHETNDNNNE